MNLTKAPLLLTLALLTLALLALLAGCGGSGGGSTSAPTTTASGGATTQTSPASQPKGGGKSQGTKPTQSNGAAPTDPNPLPNQGTKAVAPGVPTAKGGDNSIQTYGLEADSAERIQLASIAEAYLDAEATGQWARACSYLSSLLRGKFAELGNRSPASVGKGCGGGLATLFSKAPQATLRSAVPIHVLSLRVKGDQAFVIYRDATGKPFNLPLVREGGEWTVSAPAGIGLVL